MLIFSVKKIIGKFTKRTSLNNIKTDVKNKKNHLQQKMQSKMYYILKYSESMNRETNV